MGGHGSGRKAEPIAVARGGEEFVLPNLSGDHSVGTARSTPTKDTDIANKKYVDDTAGESVPASNVTPGGFGGNANYSFPTTLTISGSILNILPTSGVSTIRSNDSNTRMDYSTNRSTGTQTAHRFIVDGTTTAMNILDSKDIVMFGNLSGSNISGSSLQEVGASGSGMVVTRADGTMTGGHTIGGGNGAAGLWENPSNGVAQLISGSDTISGSALDLTGTGTILDVSGSALISGSLTVGSKTGDQLLVDDGNSSNPGLAGRIQDNTGIKFGSGRMDFVAQGGDVGYWDINGFNIITAGTASVPSISGRNTDQDTGLFWPALDTFAMSAGGVEFLRLKETTQDELIVNDTGVDIDFRVESDINPETFFIDGATGNVAIGTSTVPTGSGSLMIAHTASQPGTPGVSGSVLFASGSELWVIGGEGTFTRLAVG